MKKPYITIANIVIEIISFAIAIISLIVAAILSVTIKGDLATHFDIYGNPDGYSSPAGLLLIPIIMLAVVIVMILMGHFMPPSIINLPFKVKPEKATIVYHDAVLGVNIAGLEMGLFGLVITIILALGYSDVDLLCIVYVVVLLVTEFACIFKAFLDNRK